MKNYAIVLASGSSSRFEDELPKQFAQIDDKTVLEHCILAFENNPKITDIIVVCNPDYMELSKKILNGKFQKITAIINGGKTRQESSFLGISLVKEDNANVLIHDGARPFVSQKIIDDCILALEKFDAAAVAINSTDTIIKVDENEFISEIPTRNYLRRIQTPQAFKANIIKQAHNLAKNNPTVIVTDDCGMVVHFNLAKIKILQGDEANIKITFKKDLNR